MQVTDIKTHEVAGIEYHSKSGCSTISVVVEYQMIQDGDELVPEIQRLFFDEWVEETRALKYEVRMAFYDDWKKGLVTCQ